MGEYRELINNVTADIKPEDPPFLDKHIISGPANCEQDNIPGDLSGIDFDAIVRQLSTQEFHDDERPTTPDFPPDDYSEGDVYDSDDILNDSNTSKLVDLIQNMIDKAESRIMLRLKRLESKILDEIR